MNHSVFTVQSSLLLQKQNGLVTENEGFSYFPTVIPQHVSIKLEYPEAGLYRESACTAGGRVWISGTHRRTGHGGPCLKPQPWGEEAGGAH